MERYAAPKIGMPPHDSDTQVRAKALVGGRFKVERLIGRGGMGEVFAASHAITGRLVALKFVRPDIRSGKGQAQRFLREARIASALRHPNIVEVLDAFEEGGAAVLVMELLVGETLSAYRTRAGTLPLSEAAEILVPVARALSAAHRRGVVHRDLKPDNIFLATGSGSRPVPKVLDFGIAKVLDFTELVSELDGYATSTGAIVGTPHYMSPEQAMSDRDIDAKADIWSLGVILFEALAGRRPVTFETLGQMYAAFLGGSIPPVRDALPGLPGDVVALLERCLVIDKKDRADSLAPFIETLEPYVAASVGDRRATPPLATPALRSWSLERRRRIPAAWAVAILLAAVAAWTVTREIAPGPSAPSVAGDGTLSTSAAPAPPDSLEGEEAHPTRAAPSAASAAGAHFATSATSLAAPPSPHAPPPAPSHTLVKKGILQTPPY